MLLCLPIAPRPRSAVAGTVLLLMAVAAAPAGAMPNQKRYYAHDAVADAHGVIAPWYRGPNGQLDLRVRIAAETLKRYPWALPPKAPAPAPEFVYSGAWKIAPDGAISIPPINDWANGDLGQRAYFLLTGFVDYYRYSGDPAAIALLSVTADTILDHNLTGPDHPWPGVLVSAPTKGRPYGKADPHGFIQLDIVAEVGLGLLRAYQVAGNPRWLDTAKHWGDLFAAKRMTDPSLPPWPRYANPEDVGWEDTTTGSVTAILEFLDELIRLGHAGKDNAIVAARDAGRAYLRDVLLPRWLQHDAWGRNYWDWPCPVQDEITTETAARYLMDHPDAFPSWRTDARNILTLFLNRTSAHPGSRGDVYHGAWAYPESSGCCGRSLWYAPLEVAPFFAQYGALADDPWMRELARRQMILATYDVHETGVVEDGIDGGPVVAGDWFKIAHPMALKHVLAAIAWQPELFAPPGENHIVRSTATVSHVRYDAGVEFFTHDAPPPTVTVLRLAAHDPDILVVEAAKDGAGVVAGLVARPDLAQNGFVISRLPGGDALVSIRHDGILCVRVRGWGPREIPAEKAPAYDGAWTGRSGDARPPAASPFSSGDALDRWSSEAGASVSYAFAGSHVRLIGHAGPAGGLADVYVDGVKQAAGVDAWAPVRPDRGHHQVLYYRNGLPAGTHTLKVAVRGEKNPLSSGTEVGVHGIVVANVAGPAAFGEASGPTGPQRMVFGRPDRTDYVDAQGRAWRPGMEFVVRAGNIADTVAASWWTERRRIAVPGTPDPELYRYGIHAREFTVYVTVGPGTYHARLKFMETRSVDARARAMTVAINEDVAVADLDLAATAGGLNRPVDLVFNGLTPRHGTIEVRCTGSGTGEAILQALEVAPGDGGEGAKAVCLEPAKPGGTPAARVLQNPWFEKGVVGQAGTFGATGGGHGWYYLFGGAGTGYVWNESHFGPDHTWGAGVFHGGKEALRMHTDGNGRVTAYQEVEVEPDTPYRASVWVRAADLRGKGFGTTPGDSAGLWIEERNAADRVVRTHPRVAVTDSAVDYRELALSFRTGAATTRVRFLLDAVLACHYTEGHVTFDDCALERER